MTLALRREADQAPPDLRITIYQLLALWGMKPKPNPPLYESLAKCARVPEAAIPYLDNWGYADRGPSEMWKTSPSSEFIVDTLDKATNTQVVRHFLADHGTAFSMDQDRKLAVWLNSLDSEIRFFAAVHFAQTRKRPDLLPIFPYFASQQSDHSNPPKPTDLDEKVAAWKQFFGIS